MKQQNYIKLSQLQGATLTYNEPDGTTVIVDFDTSEFKKSN